VKESFHHPIINIKMNRKRLRLQFLIIALFMMFVFSGDSGNSNEIPSMDQIVNLPPDEIWLPLGAFGLVDGSPDTFIRRNGLRWFLEGVEFSMSFPEENVLTVNGNRVPTDNLVIEEHLLTANITLDDGRNEVTLKVYDMMGRALYYEATLWAGDNTVTVSLVNPDGTPFTKQTEVIASVAEDPTVATRMVTSNGIAPLVNIPDCAILINAKSVNNEYASASVSGVPRLVKITMYRQ
jgi:hypothetical protein